MMTCMFTALGPEVALAGGSPSSSDEISTAPKSFRGFQGIVARGTMQDNI